MRPSPPDVDPVARRIAGADPRTPRVSVIVAACNAAPYIEEACRSALDQTWASLEVIVVDDGSTDGTGDIVRAIAASDPRLRLIRQDNRGVAAARNRAIAAASGEFIAPLDADDVWESTKIERQVQRLQDCGPAAGFVYCWWAWIDGRGGVLDRSPRWQIEGQVLDRLVEINFTGNASVPLYRRSAVEEAGGYNAGLRDRGCQGCEDWELALRVAERHTVSFVPAVLVGYRRRADGMSGECETMSRSRAQVMAALAARQPSIPSTVLQRSSGQFALHLAGVAFWSGHYLQACRWALRARPLTLGLAVLPHAATMIARRWLRIGQPGIVRLGASKRFDESSLPPPHIPYDRIYARHWRRHAGG